MDLTTRDSEDGETSYDSGGSEWSDEEAYLEGGYDEEDSSDMRHVAHARSTRPPSPVPATGDSADAWNQDNSEQRDYSWIPRGYHVDFAGRLRPNSLSPVSASTPTPDLLGMYDPFSRSFPCDAEESEWGREALDFIGRHMSGSSTMDEFLDFLTAPLEESQICSLSGAESNGESQMLRRWFLSLSLEVQIEVWLQRKFDLGKRPRSKWIIGPYEERLPVWEGRVKRGECRIVDPFIGFQLGYFLQGR